MPGVSCEDYYFTNSWKCTNLIDIIVFNDIIETCVQVIQEIHDLKLKKTHILLNRLHKHEIKNW